MIQQKKKTGIILAAGIGSRIRESGIKPLLDVNKIGLLIRTIHSHDVANCEKIVIVLGWQAKKIKHYILSHYKGRTPLKFIQNNKYQLKNGISVLCARTHIGSEFILTMADHILDDNIMSAVKETNPPNGGATLCVDFKLDTIFDMDDATKVYVEDNKIKKIGKHLKQYNCVDTGVFIGTEGLMKAIDQIYKGRGDASLSDGVQLLADQNLMNVLDIGNSFWQDVDTPEMLAHAEELLRFHGK